MQGVTGNSNRITGQFFLQRETYRKMTVNVESGQGSKWLFQVQEYSKETIMIQRDKPRNALPGDFWSPESTADRIFDFAKDLAGGDKGKLDMLRNAVAKGFKEVENILNGLPEVSRQTYHLVMKKFDQWERGVDNLV